MWRKVPKFMTLACDWLPARTNSFSTIRRLIVISPISRRDALRVLPGIAAASKLFAQSKRQLPVKTLSHVTLRVSDPKRSIEFYQGLFGLPNQAYQGPDENALPTLR